AARPARPKRRPVAAVTLGSARVLLTIDALGREWGLELSAEVERALSLCDGTRPWANVVAALADAGASGGDALLAELTTYGAIEAGEPARFAWAREDGIIRSPN